MSFEVGKEVIGTFRGHQVTGKITYYAGRTGDWLVTFDKDCWDKVGINAWYFQLEALKKNFVLAGHEKVSLSSVIKKVAMNINKDDLHTLWYEDEDGNKYTQVQFDGPMPPDLPKGYKYQISQFPNVLRTTALTTSAKEDVDACPHPEEYVARTGGWIDSVKGRECKLCGGSQTVDIADYPEDIWPEDWDAGNSQVAYAFESSWPEDLALAMATSGDYTLGEAILIAGNNCERCMNALAHKYGLDWGYPEYSEEWQLTGTECDFCRGEKMGKTARIPFGGVLEIEELYRTIEAFDDELVLLLPKVEEGVERVHGDRLPKLKGEVHDIIKFFDKREEMSPFYKLVNEIESEIDYSETEREYELEEGLISSMILVAQEEKSICVDFDGTLVQYDGFKGEGVFGDVLEGAKEVLKALSEDGWLIIIFTCRGEEDLIADFLQENEVPFDHINRRPDMHPNQNQGKPHAQYYVDDRAIEFKGNWPEIYQRVTGQPWKERRAMIKEMIKDAIRLLSQEEELPPEGEKSEEEEFVEKMAKKILKFVKDDPDETERICGLIKSEIKAVLEGK